MSSSGWIPAGQRWQQRIDGFTERCGATIAWLNLLMLAAMVSTVVLRYVFATGSIALQESVLYLHAIIFMTAMGFTLRREGHVRVDIFYRAMNERHKAMVDVGGTLFLLLPFCAFLFVSSFNYVLASWSQLESSADAGGLPFLYVLKSFLLVMPVLLLLQGIAEVLRRLPLLLASKDLPHG